MRGAKVGLSEAKPDKKASAADLLTWSLQKGRGGAGFAAKISYSTHSNPEIPPGPSVPFTRPADRVTL